MPLSNPPIGYGLTCAFTGDTKRALEHAFAVLSMIGFRAESRSDVELTMIGPGYRGTRQNQLLGASRIRIAREGDHLILDAELGGVATMKRFVALFPIAIAAGVFLVVGLAFGLIFRGNLALPFGILATVIGIQVMFWMAAGPAIARVVEARVKQALETLLHNAAFAGQN